jgi:methyl-galactoside transport system ATP-binding protein
MSVSDRQMVEIAKAVSYDARVIVFDEPTSSLNDREVEHLFRIIRMLRERGCGIIYISHKMEEILAISDDVTVMRDGRHVATEAASALDIDTIIRLMVGRTLENRFPEKTNRPGEPIMTVSHLSARYNPLRGISFTLRRGEILGVAGLAGAGRSELLQTLYGLAVRDGGEIVKEGRALENRTPRQAIRNGFALLTEERRATGIFGALSIRENMTVASLSRYLSGGLLLNEGKRQRATERMIRSMQIKTPTQRTQIRTLSGGNQQKVILGRWLLTDPDVLLLDEPTRGIDIGAKYEIYRLMIELAEQGKAIMMVSSEMPELLGVCDRILVLSSGRLAGMVDAKNTDQEQIMTLAAKYV